MRPTASKCSNLREADKLDPASRKTSALNSRIANPSDRDGEHIEHVSKNDKSHRGNASQFFVAGELCRRGYAAVVTLGNTPNVDVLCSDKTGRRFVHIQVKTFVPGNKTCSVGKKAEKASGPSFFWVIAGIPEPGTNESFRYFIVPSEDMARNVKHHHQAWLKSPGMKGQKRNDSAIRAVGISEKASSTFWIIAEFENRWDLIDKALGL